MRGWLPTLLLGAFVVVGLLAAFHLVPPYAVTVAWICFALACILLVAKSRRKD